MHPGNGHNTLIPFHNTYVQMSFCSVLKYLLNMQHMVCGFDIVKLNYFLNKKKSFFFSCRAVCCICTVYVAK